MVEQLSGSFPRVGRLIDLNTNSATCTEVEAYLKRYKKIPYNVLELDEQRLDKKVGTGFNNKKKRFSSPNLKANIIKL